VFRSFGALQVSADIEFDVGRLYDGKRDRKFA
jgi:hypothetical protein